MFEAWWFPIFDARPSKAPYALWNSELTSDFHSTRHSNLSSWLEDFLTFRTPSSTTTSVSIVGALPLRGVATIRLAIGDHVVSNQVRTHTSHYVRYGIFIGVNYLHKKRRSPFFAVSLLPGVTTRYGLPPCSTTAISSQNPRAHITTPCCTVI